MDVGDLVQCTNVQAQMNGSIAAVHYAGIVQSISDSAIPFINNEGGQFTYLFAFVGLCNWNGIRKDQLW